MTAIHRTLAAGFLDFLLPRHCAVSGQPLLEDRGPVAPEIMRQVELAGADYCRRCGAPQGDGVGVITGCISCNDVRDGFGTREIAAVGRYRGVLEELCLALKFGGQRALAKPIAAWLTPMLHERGIAAHIEAVAPVPLSALRKLKRGYNQAELIARELARSLGKPLLPHALRRMKHTQRQALLSAAQRRSNVEDVFVVRDPAKITGLTLLLVDDVMTTGATFASAARALKKAGAKAVYGVVAARAALGDDR